MEQNIYNNEQTYNQPVQPTQQGRKFNTNQMSLLSQAMLAAGVGFILIALVGLGFFYLMLNTPVDITLMGVLSIILIIVAMVLSMVMTYKLQTASKALVFSVGAVYIIAEGIGFGILFAAFYVAFSASKAISYLLLIFAAGGLSFLICALIGKKMSLRATIALSKGVGYMSIGFMGIMFVTFLASIIVSFTTSGGFMGSGLGLMIVGLSTILFFLYMVGDMAMISKMQNFMQINDSKFAFNLVMFFGGKLLVDLVGLVGNIAILVLRFAR